MIQRSRSPRRSPRRVPSRSTLATIALALVVATVTRGAARPVAAAPARPPAPPMAQPSAAPRGSVLVTIAGPSVWQRYGDRLRGGPDAPTGAADVRARAAAMHDELAAAREAVLSAQAPAVAAIEAIGAQVISRYATFANGLLVHATADQVARMAGVPGILAVEPAPLVRPLLDASVPFIGAPALHALKGYDGAGSFTAVIDTGVDYTHAHLGGPGTIEAWQAASAEGASERIDDLWQDKPLFPTAKVVAGYDFAGRHYNPPHLCSAAQEAAGECTSTPKPDMDPIDGAGHGSHVSGITAGNAFPDGLSDGVAPGAKLVGLKIYGEGGDDEAADMLVDAIEWCGNVNLTLETRGTLPPRVDAVNISLGEDWAVASTLFDTTAASVAGAGVTVVASAGNSGNRAFIVGTPSASPTILSVASSVPPEMGMEILVTHDGTTDSHLAVESAIARPLKDVVATIDTKRLEAPLGWFGRGCNDDEPLQDVAERVALIARGDCVFSEKLLNAQAKGAIAVLMFTNESPKNTMGGDGAGITIPAAMIDREPGEALRDLLLAGTEATVSFDPMRRRLDTSSADQIAGYSSRGPSVHGALKPDITAPGSNINSALMGTGVKGGSWNGTSMASPHVTGAAGVIAQRNRTEKLGLDGLGVAALLMNYTQQGVLAGSDIVPIARQGAGRVDVLRAGTGPLLVRTGPIASINLGLRALTAPVTTSVPLTVTNLTDAPVRFTLTPRVRRPVAVVSAVAFDISDRAIVLAPHVTQRIDVPTTIDPALLPAWTLYPSATGAGIDSVEAIEIDGWIAVQPVDDASAPLADAVAPAAAVPFYLLARRASAVTTNGLEAIGGARSLRFRNASPFDGDVELFHRPRQGDAPMPTDPDESNVPDELDVAAVGVRATTASTTTTTADRLDFAVVTHAPVTVPVPEQTQIFVDTDRDGTADWRIRAGDHRGGDRVQTFVGRWDPAADAITGTERITGTLFSSDVATHASVLSVPMALLGMDQPAAFDFWVVRRGTHEDWMHLGVSDVVPDGADAPGGPRLTFDPAAQARVPASYHVHVPGDAADGRGEAVVEFVVDPTKPDDGFLALYPQNDFAVDGAATGAQFGWLVPGEARPPAVYLPAVFSMFDATTP
ncbi:MAG: S8 family serine peptidase [Ardenticatenales bacterium]